MDRRDFLRKCAAVASGVALSKVAPPMLFAEDIWQFSLHVMTDAPDQAIPHMEALIKHLDLSHKRLRFQEFALSGRHVGDVVLVMNNRLINYKTAPSRFTESVLQVSQSLGLPRRFDNPCVLKLSTEGEKSPARTLAVFRNNSLVTRFDLAENIQEQRIDGARGSVLLSIKNGSAQLDGASCKHKTCVKMGGIHKAGQQIICIPNQVRITVTGQPAHGLDTLAF
ncbi:MAG: NusG domain II-containing protein [bacterium]